jgi:hypothetical protein
VGDGSGVGVSVEVGVAVNAVVEVGVAVCVTVAVAGGGGVTVLVSANVGVGGADWAVNVAATRVATIISKVDVEACVEVGRGFTVSVGVDAPLQLVNRITIKSKKLIRDFIDKLHLQNH